MGSSIIRKIAACAGLLFLVGTGLTACGGGSGTHEAGGASSGGPGTGGGSASTSSGKASTSSGTSTSTTSGASTSNTSSSGGTGGAGGSGAGGSGAGGADGGTTGPDGPPATALVSAGQTCTSPGYKMVFTMGQPTQNQTKTVSSSYRMQGGLIGATGTLP